MKKALMVILAAVMVLSLAACGTGTYKIGDCETAASKLEAAGFTVEVITDEAGLAAYNGDGLNAVVVAYLGDEWMEEPVQEELEDYRVCELYYFDSADQAKAFWTENDFQMSHQAWSDAYYYYQLRYYYTCSGSMVYCGLGETLEICE